MKNKEKTVHEPRIQMARRDDMIWYKSWGVRVIAVILALIICGFVIVLLTGYNPLEVYVSMFKGTFGTSRKVWNTLQKLAMLLCVSLAVTPAFKMKFWNIGAEGQTLVGGLASAACMIYLGGSVPNIALIPIMFVTSIVAGLIWGIVPAFFKAKFDTNETLFTLMMNYVAMTLVSYFIMVKDKSGRSDLGIINERTGYGYLPNLFERNYIFNIIQLSYIVNKTAAPSVTEDAA